jgi:hypothetical protein
LQVKRSFRQEGEAIEVKRNAVTRARDQYLCPLAAYSPNYRQIVSNGPRIRHDALTSSSFDIFSPFILLKVFTRAGTTQKDFPIEIPKAASRNSGAAQQLRRSSNCGELPKRPHMKRTTEVATCMYFIEQKKKRKQISIRLRRTATDKKEK